VIADFSEVRVEEMGSNRVWVTGGKGAPKTGLLKTSVGYVDSYVGEGQISYAGPNAVTRARLALDIVRERLACTGVHTTETRFDLIGIDSLHGKARTCDGDPYEVRIRVVGRADSLEEARRIGEEGRDALRQRPRSGWRGLEVGVSGRRRGVGVDPRNRRPNNRNDQGGLRPMRLWETAHSRSGDKGGDTSNISVIAFDPNDYPLIVERMTAERVASHFAKIATGPVRRYELPNIRALNFVLEGALAGGVTPALKLDAHGKSPSSLMLDLEI
jgi:hypothetical protein